MDEVGSRLGRYRLLGRLGQGGMGRLYMAARDGAAGTSKIVALKCVLPELASRPEFKRMFLDEARVAIQLAHPHIVTTHELGEVDGKYFISMEYVPGEDLAQILKRCRRTGNGIPLRVAVQIAIACASALEYAHTLADSKGRPLHVVHCDVNPTNVMVSYQGAVKLLDFGIARFRLNRVGDGRAPFRGKVTYSALEQLDGGVLDARTDVFCLGIVLWEMLSGRKLFDAANPMAAVEALRSQPVAPPSLFRSEVPPDLDALVLDSLQRDPSLRPQSAAYFALRLERIGAKLGGGVSESGLASWITTLFGAERANEKLRAAQSGPRDEITQEAATPILDLSKPALAQPAPRVAWSTDAAGGSAVLSMGGREESNDVGRQGPLGRSPSRSADARFEPEERHLVPPIGERSATLDVSDPSLPAEPSRRRFVKEGLVVSFVVLAGTMFGWSLLDDGPTPVDRSVSPPVVWVTSDPEGGRVYVDGEPTGMVTPARLTGVAPATTLRIRVDFPDGGAVTRQVRVPETGEARVRVSAESRSRGRTP